jgi:hypothetical protein
MNWLEEMAALMQARVAAQAEAGPQVPKSPKSPEEAQARRGALQSATEQATGPAWDTAPPFSVSSLAEALLAPTPSRGASGWLRNLHNDSPRLGQTYHEVIDPGTGRIVHVYRDGKRVVLPRRRGPGLRRFA